MATRKYTAIKQKALVYFCTNGIGYSFLEYSTCNKGFVISETFLSGSGLKESIRLITIKMDSIGINRNKKKRIEMNKKESKGIKRSQNESK